MLVVFVRHAGSKIQDSRDTTRSQQEENETNGFSRSSHNTFRRGDVHASVVVHQIYWVPQTPRWGHPTPRSTGRKFGRLT
jgi:hypothetical protein